MIYQNTQEYGMVLMVYLQFSNEKAAKRYILYDKKLLSLE